MKVKRCWRIVYNVEMLELCQTAMVTMQFTATTTTTTTIITDIIFLPLFLLLLSTGRKPRLRKLRIICVH